MGKVCKTENVTSVGYHPTLYTKPILIHKDEITILV